MKKSSGTSVTKKCSGAVGHTLKRMVYVVVFICLPLHQAKAIIQLTSPFDVTDKVTVFRWTPSEDAALDTYRIIFTDPQLDDDIVLELPGPNDKKIVMPQLGLDLEDLGIFDEDKDYAWRVEAINQFGGVIDQSQEPPGLFRFLLEDGIGFSLIRGLVLSDLNQLESAQVEILDDHSGSRNSKAETTLNGEFIAVALATSGGRPVDPPIRMTASRKGYETTELTLNDVSSTTDIEFRLKPLGARAVPAILHLLLNR